MSIRLIHASQPVVPLGLCDLKSIAAYGLYGNGNLPESGSIGS